MDDFFKPSFVGRDVTISVSELNDYIKSIIDGDYALGRLSIRGEISNFTAHRSGHFYFSLKDENSLIRAVMFRSYTGGLRFRPESGMKVIATGSVSVFVRDGQYQLYVTDMQPDGIGALWLAYEQLKKKLAAEGLFDEARKRPLPKFPRRVGVITSPTGAAVRDIINITGRRYPSAEIALYPAEVQGDGAVPSLITGLRYFNAFSAADVIIIGRGGGSIEDLWAFNDETLAREIVASEIPVISAVGHVTDFTICDFVADLRAPTPSAAAELAVPDQHTLLADLHAINARLKECLLKKTELYRARIDAIRARRVFDTPDILLAEKQNRLSSDAEALEHSLTELLNTKKNQLAVLTAKAEVLSPLSVLSRGYTVTEDKNGVIVKSKEQLCEGDVLTTHFCDGSVSSVIMTYGDKNEKQ